MNDRPDINTYSSVEEKLNIFSHAIGLGLSFLALFLLLQRASLYGNTLQVVGFGVFGVSLVALYAASTCYHSSSKPGLRARLRIVDHASIYVLIAGTYTPFMLITLSGSTGWLILAISWSLAFSGIVLKLFFTGNYEMLSTLMYVFMGWIVIFVLKPLVNNLPMEGLAWLIAGGLSYTVGAIVYSIDRISLNHAIFHLFVLVGSFCHFMAVYFYVLPTP